MTIDKRPKWPETTNALRCSYIFSHGRVTGGRRGLEAGDGTIKRKYCRVAGAADFLQVSVPPTSNKNSCVSSGVEGSGGQNSIKHDISAVAPDSKPRRRLGAAAGVDNLMHDVSHTKAFEQRKNRGFKCIMVFRANADKGKIRDGRRTLVGRGVSSLRLS